MNPSPVSATIPRASREALSPRTAPGRGLRTLAAGILASCLSAAVSRAGDPPPESFAGALGRFRTAQESGFRWTAADTFPRAYTTNRTVTDDGPMGAPLLGGIGTGAFGRDLQGHFNRWQLQPGFARVRSVDAASLCLRWRQGGRSGAYRLGEAGWDRPLPAGSRSVAILWPVVSEHLGRPDWPVEAVVESWSPVVPRDDGASALPVAFFDVYARNTTAEPASLDLALFMPNFLGWRGGYGLVTAPEHTARYAGDRIGPRSWLERSNSGNHPEPAEADPSRGLLAGVLFRRSGYVLPSRDMEGEVLLGVGGGSAVRAQRDVCAAVVRREGESPAGAASNSLDYAERAFFETGRLPIQERGWSSEANEVLASAVAGGLTLAPGQEGHFTLVVVWDTPLVEFGSGRTWEKTYTAKYGADGRQARRIALDALAGREAWRRRIDRWQQETLGKGGPRDRLRRGACINDLSYVISGGTCWVAREHANPALEPPLLGSGEHFSILEGATDNGYYFCTTFDLWPHAQPAFEANWPHLAGLVMDDYLRTVPMTIADPRFITGPGRFVVRKVANKVPHDLGCPAGDPWSRLNEYGSTRDSNVWKDHNPEFILSLYLHRKAGGGAPPGDAEWAVLLGVADFMIAQDKNHDGLPYHDTQGDSTWDALQFTGPSPYSGALTIGAWAALADWSRQRGDVAQEKRFNDRLHLAQASFERCFWNGRYYRSATNGPQAEWVLADALFGILLAESAGLHGLLPADHVSAFLREVAARNWRDFGDGTIGPALLVPPEGPIPSGRTQVGEVLVGSARSCAALMKRFGLGGQGDAMADAVNRTLYVESGLQFRTPAAWTAERTFRAPANLRPLASWFFLWPDRL